MYPDSPRAGDVTRSRLRQVAYWIRDELDPIIAREGPEHLRADDVLFLHDMFQTLCTSSSITALDLRATGIHKAILDISGIATRWPGRLCDDCDKIISIWTAKFGRLEDLRPFLYGRGGCLEGIASVEQSSKQALIKRWQATCPDKISPKRSHRHGNLGFRAGEWWINPLFACHAGIIDIDSTEGGICYDKNGAYAMLLKDTGEIEAPSETNFKYRCGREDKGRFRLTAATAKSRTPIRVLRSHSINSIWGPKAGVRYEGLYNVVGWTVHQMKTAKISNDEYRAGDIVYDVQLERRDPVPMEEVVKIPTTFQVDQYTEYKRLRKVYREMQRNGGHGGFGKLEARPLPSKVAPPISPLPPPISLPMTQSKGPASSLRTTTFKDPITPFAEPSSRPSSRQAGTVGLPDPQVEDEELLRAPPKSMLGVPAQTTMRPTTQYCKSESLHSDSQSYAPTLQNQMSNASINRTSVITEVTPWVEAELEFYARPSSPPTTVGHEETQRVSRNSTMSPRTVQSRARDSPSPMRKRESDDKKRKNFVTAASPSQDLKKKESRKSILVRSRNPMAKLFDGAEDAVSSGDDYFSYKRRANSVVPKRTSPMVMRRERTGSSHEPPLSPIPLRPISPTSPLLMGRRDAICLPYGYVITPSTPSINFYEHPAPHPVSVDDTFMDISPARSIPSLPISLQSLISKSKPTSALTTPISSPRLTYTRDETEKVDDTTAVYQSRKFIEVVGDEIKIIFKNPFVEQGGRQVVRRSSSVSVAPDVIAEPLDNTAAK